MKFTVRTGPFHGDADQLLDQIETTSEALNRGRGVRVTGAPTTIVTDQGKQGATVRVTGPHTAGVIAAFVFGGRGVEAVATGPSDAGAEPAAAVSADDPQHQPIRRGESGDNDDAHRPRSCPRRRARPLRLGQAIQLLPATQLRILGIPGCWSGSACLTFFSTLARRVRRLRPGDRAGGDVVRHLRRAVLVVHRAHRPLRQTARQADGRRRSLGRLRRHRGDGGERQRRDPRPVRERPSVRCGR